MLRIFDLISSKGIICRLNEPMSEHTTFKIGGPADLFIEPKSEEEAAEAVSICRENNVSITVIGNGSNLLVSDDGIEGAVICFGREFSKITVEDTKIYAESGAMLSHVCIAAGDNGLTGLEFAFGIPGAVGGAVFMNAGAYGGNISDVVVSSLCYDTRTDCIRKIDLEEHEFKYRESIYSKNPHLIILAVMMELVPGKNADIIAEMNKNVRARKEKQPLEFPSAGSVFKRPLGHYAGEMIEKSGLKGFRIGGAEVSEKHAGFIINRGTATSKDVLDLIEHIKKTVYENYEVELECEVRFIGN